jgi:hypothetical protein
MEERPGSNGAEHGVHDQLGRGMVGAQDNVVCDPGQKKPPRPVGTAEGENPADDCKEPEEEYPGGVFFKYSVSTQLGRVIDNSNHPRHNEEPADDRNSEWPLRQLRAFVFPPVFMYDGSSLKK